MSDNHNHPKPNSFLRLIVAIVVNTGIVIFEIIFGILTNSVALISDAVHNLGDIAALTLSYWAEKISKRSTSEKKTYGYKKIEFLAAFVNSLILSVAIIFVTYEAINRLINPLSIEGNQMLFVAIVAFVGNSIATLVLLSSSKQNFNLKVAWLHSLQDALFSLAVIVAAVFIHYFNWYILDPLLSLFIVFFIAREIYHIIAHTVNSLLDSVPEGVEFGQVKADLLAVDGIRSVDDLHIWQLNSEENILSTHIRMDSDNFNNDKVVKEIKEILSQKYKINHSTIQVMSANTKTQTCNHCN